MKAIPLFALALLACGPAEPGAPTSTPSTDAGAPDRDAAPLGAVPFDGSSGFDAGVAPAPAVTFWAACSLDAGTDADANAPCTDLHLDEFCAPTDTGGRCVFRCDSLDHELSCIGAGFGHCADAGAWLSPICMPPL